MMKVVRERAALAVGRRSEVLQAKTDERVCEVESLVRRCGYKIEVGSDGGVGNEGDEAVLLSLSVAEAEAEAEADMTQEEMR